MGGMLRCDDGMHDMMYGYDTILPHKYVLYAYESLGARMMVL